MSQVLPRLRPGLDIFPSPLPDQPGFLLRDPLRYSEAVVILPPVAASALPCFDGEQTSLDLQVHLTRMTGGLVTSDAVDGFIAALQGHGFLETEEFEHLRSARHAQFAAQPVRLPAHAGTAYPQEPLELRACFESYLELETRPRQGEQIGLETHVEPSVAVASTPDRPSIPPETRIRPDALVGIAAPHVSPVGGHAAYASAYAQLGSRQDERTFVILGTSHYGQPESFGLTRKPFATPYGTLPIDVELLDELLRGAGDSAVLEDYCHSVEHSIEFQCVFLQHVLGPGCRILPILCGPFAESVRQGTPPESDPKVARFLHALAELAERHRRRIFWVLGIDLAHLGRRYGDDYSARAEVGSLLAAGAQDKERLDRVCEGDAAGFLELVRPQNDVLRWCGFSPLYAFLKAVPQVRGELWRYEQWNIDPHSVVSFAALGFHEA